MPRLLLVTTLAHALLGVVLACALRVKREPIMGVHPAMKPLKFAVSIALFLGTMALLLPKLSVDTWTREALAWLFASTMVAETVVIVGQAARGTTSHFNVQSPLDKAGWNVMFMAIVAATLGIVAVVFLATTRPLILAGGGHETRLMALAWRAGLLLLMLAPLSGFAMGGRLRHSVGGEDGEPGLPLFDWSVRHGDLRVAHFFALHAVQVLPLLAWGLLRVDAPGWARVAIVVTVSVALGAICVGTLVQAFAGRPFLGSGGAHRRRARGENP